MKSTSHVPRTSQTNSAQLKQADGPRPTVIQKQGNMKSKAS